MYRHLLVQLWLRKGTKREKRYRIDNHPHALLSFMRQSTANRKFRSITTGHGVANRSRAHRSCAAPVFLSSVDVGIIPHASVLLGRSGDHRPPLLRAVGMLIRLNTLEQRKVTAASVEGDSGLWMKL
uniref:Uncharacterized protein n=1 Tax=Ananas comosus var. bracteatus TaxID=296719 RepID=A0A6V7QDJ9_ANACO|nr:unnamed protein product [Ananas comosus var. bracteatus]